MPSTSESQQHPSSFLLLSYSSHVYTSIAECADANGGSTEQCEKEKQKKNQHHQPTTWHVLSRFCNIKFLPLASLQWGTLVTFLASTRFPPFQVTYCNSPGGFNSVPSLCSAAKFMNGGTMISSNKYFRLLHNVLNTPRGALPAVSAVCVCQNKTKKMKTSVRFKKKFFWILMLAKLSVWL